jgi:radical SAM superfamily enzyme YgiQ (UPF0313 family)
VNVVLISTYELGRQPFGLASPSAVLRRHGHEVICADLATGGLPVAAVRQAGLVAFHLPMHTATRLAVPVIDKVRRLNPDAHLCCYGLYAPLNERFLRAHGVGTLIGGEFETTLASLADTLHRGERPDSDPTIVSLDRISFLPPDRSRLPELQRYAHLVMNGDRRVVGYTEASRGCKHLCRHCPVVPVYEGRFRIVPLEVVLADVRQQVAAGARHITFGDPDFFNGPAHARAIVEAVHREFPDLTYDVTIKVEHLLKRRDLVPVLKETGCLFVTTAVESVDDLVLERLEKGHTRADFYELARLFRGQGLSLAPTFIPFTPWTTLAGYQHLLRAVAETGLAGSVSPIQLALRLLIPAGSRLLELDDVRSVAGHFDPASLAHPWKHPDEQMDMLAERALNLVRRAQAKNAPRHEVFRQLWTMAHNSEPPDEFDLMPRCTVPYLEEPWYC